MSRRAGWTAALLLAVGLTPAAAQTEASPLVDVAVGYGDVIAPESAGPTPVWLTLAHPGGGQELQVELALNGGGAAWARSRLSLPPGSRKRVCLALRIDTEDGLLVDVSVDGETREQRQIDQLVPFEPGRHLLVLDGRRAEERPGGGELLDPLLQVSALPAGDAPTEASCYAVFGTVLVLGADLTAWDVDQREALLEFVTNGGTLLVGELTPQRMTSAFFRQTCGPSTKQKLLDRMASRWHLGLGRVLAFPDDLLAAAQGDGPRASRIRQLLGDLVQESRAGAVFPRLYDELELSLFEGPGKTSRLLVLAFVGSYFLLAGPVLAVAFRKASRRRLAAVTVGLVSVFCLLAPVVAGVVRSANGGVYQRGVLYVPLEGPAFELAELTVVSGGATAYALRASGPQMAATVFPTGQFRERDWHGNGRWARPEPETLSTRRGQAIDLDLQLTPWARQSVSVQAVTPGFGPVTAEVRRDANGLTLRLENTTQTRLRSAFVVRAGSAINEWGEYLPVGDLAPGEQRELPLDLARRGGIAKPWTEYVGIEQAWTSWQLQPPAWRTHQGSFQLVSLAESELQLRSDGLTVSQVTLRVDELPPWQRRTRGFLGVQTEDGAGQVRVTQPLPGSPADRAGIAAGDIILFVEDQRVESGAALRRAISAREPGEDITLELRDSLGQPKRVTVTLVQLLERR